MVTLVKAQSRLLGVMGGWVVQAKQQFLLSVGHDLRTPLTSIRGYAEGARFTVSLRPVPS
jgi:signal transduction histidine kinase